MNYDEAYQKLAKCGQLHVLKAYEVLSQQEKEQLLDQIELTDFSVLASVGQKDLSARGEITPLAAMELPEIEEKKETFHAKGVEEIKNGTVGAVLLAGGMGTRLGSDNPKGMFDIGLTKPVYIFERIITNLLDVVRETESWIHLFVMTSDKNHEKTTAFLKEHAYFGYKEEYVHFFRQEMAPASDYTGKVYMESAGKIANSPNGNGGWFGSMIAAGLDTVIRAAGIRWLNVFAVDNVLQRIADPTFVGATVLSGTSCGAKVVRKNAPDEKVGVMCLEDGHPSIVEYYELTEKLMHEKNANGDPAYNFGVILNYLFSVEQLFAIAEKKLPLHIVEKKIPYMDEQGKLVKPEKPNGYKFENLILDMVYLMDGCLPYEVVREREFAPIKNMTGIDSVESARALCALNKIEL